MENNKYKTLIILIGVSIGAFAGWAMTGGDPTLIFIGGTFITAISEIVIPYD